MGTFDDRRKKFENILVVGLDDFYARDIRGRDEYEEIMKLADEKRTSLRLDDTFYDIILLFYFRTPGRKNTDQRRVARFSAFKSRLS